MQAGYLGAPPPARDAGAGRSPWFSQPLAGRQSKRKRRLVASFRFFSMPRKDFALRSPSSRHITPCPDILSHSAALATVTSHPTPAPFRAPHLRRAGKVDSLSTPPRRSRRCKEGCRGGLAGGARKDAGAACLTSAFPDTPLRQFRECPWPREGARFLRNRKGALRQCRGPAWHKRTRQASSKRSCR